MEQPSAQLAKAGPGLALPIVGAKRSSDSMAGDEAVDLASNDDEDMAGDAEAEAMAAEKAF
eukprot:351805-Chlamydomonas_euryale.AAC.1